MSLASALTVLVPCSSHHSFSQHLLASSSSPSTLLPWGLCTCCSLCQICSSARLALSFLKNLGSGVTFLRRPSLITLYKNNNLLMGNPDHHPRLKLPSEHLPVHDTLYTANLSVLECESHEGRNLVKCWDLSTMRGMQRVLQKKEEILAR